MLFVDFLGGLAPSSVYSSSLSGSGVSSVLRSNKFRLKLGSANMRADVAVFFENVNLGLGVRISGLLSSTLAELQTIALALECVLSFSLVHLFMNSQAARIEFGVSGFSELVLG
ncbi:hypothetical protein G9A89_006279 [Geosiphon pyriformis]|nr:hypothetical protein G9A89_006279 [Geosiphon pyriformis]